MTLTGLVFLASSLIGNEAEKEDARNLKAYERQLRDWEVLREAAEERNQARLDKKARRDTYARAVGYDVPALPTKRETIPGKSTMPEKPEESSLHDLSSGLGLASTYGSQLVPGIANYDLGAAITPAVNRALAVIGSPSDYAGNSADISRAVGYNVPSYQYENRYDPKRYLTSIGEE